MNVVILNEKLGITPENLFPIVRNYLVFYTRQNEDGTTTNHYYKAEQSPNRNASIIHINNIRGEWMGDMSSASPRDIQIVRLVYEGFTNPQIGARLEPELNESTVANILTNLRKIYPRLNAWLESNPRKHKKSKKKQESQEPKGM
jgi:DNA-binding NarL/FixJ family response regulator